MKNDEAIIKQIMDYSADLNSKDEVFMISS